MGRGYYAGRRAAKRHYHWNMRKPKSRKQCSSSGEDSMGGIAVAAGFVTILFLELTGLSRLINPIVASLVVSFVIIAWDVISIATSVQRSSK